MDAAFDRDRTSPIRGKDKNGQDFALTDLLAGRGKLLTFYDRDGIFHRNEMHERNFRLASRIVKDGETVNVRAGPFISESPVKVIEAR